MPVQLKINNRTIEAREGQTILEAASEHGVIIPTLCHHAGLAPTGQCRLCVVEVKDQRTLPAACVTHVWEDAEIFTDTPAVRQARRQVLGLLFNERNHFCMYCQMSGGDCRLQNAAYGEGMTHWPAIPDWMTFPVDASHPFFVLDHNRCILCRACIRACGELAGAFTLGIKHRGPETRIIADNDVPLGQSSCIACGACLQVCPTGALIDRRSAYQGQVAEMERTRSICTGCSVGCGIEMLTRDNHLVRIEGDWGSPVNRGLLCAAGRFYPLIDERARLDKPLVRRDGTLKETDWEAALDFTARQLQTLRGVVAHVSARLPAEALYLFRQIFTEHLGGTAGSVEAIDDVPANMAETLGRSFETPLEAIHSADCIVVVGADPTTSHGVVGSFVRRRQAQGARLIVIDVPANTLAAQADCFVATETEQLPAVIQSLAGHQPGQTAAAAAQLLSAAQKPVFVYGPRLSPAALKALLASAKNAPVIGLKNQANSLAAAQYGLTKPFQQAGQAAAYIALGDDVPAPELVEQWRGSAFLAVQASYVSPLTEMADVVLPAATWAEQSGHYINLEGRVQEAQRVLTAPADTRAHIDILQALANRLGCRPNLDWKAALTQRLASVALIDGE